MSDEEMRELLSGMREEPVPPDSLARVRLAVAERTRRTRGVWKMGAGILAMGSVAAMFWLSRGPGPAPVVKQPAPVAAARPAEVVPAKAEVRRRAAKPRKTETLTIRIETPDPDVVIFLVSDGTGS